MKTCTGGAVVIMNQFNMTHANWFRNGSLFAGNAPFHVEVKNPMQTNGKQMF